MFEGHLLWQASWQIVALTYPMSKLVSRSCFKNVTDKKTKRGNIAKHANALPIKTFFSWKINGSSRETLTTYWKNIQSNMKKSKTTKIQSPIKREKKIETRQKGIIIKAIEGITATTSMARGCLVILLSK